MTTYHIYIKSNKNARTINTPMNARTYFDIVVAKGRDELIAKVNELRANGEHISEIATTLGTRIYGI